MIEQACLKGIILDSTKEIFGTMIFMDMLEVDQIDGQVDGLIDGDAMLSSITFNGDMDGCLALCCGKACAQAVTMNMLGFDCTEGVTDEDVSDAMGEVANMVMGGVKKRLGETYGNLAVSIPSVTSGRNLKNSIGEGVQEISSIVKIEDEHPVKLSLLYRENLN